MLLQQPRQDRSGPRHRRRRAVRRVAAMLAAVLIGIVGVSYGQALTYPGNARWQARTVEWVRDNGGSGLVDAVENWWYAHNAPTGDAPAPGSLPSPAGAVAPVAAAAAMPTPLPLLPGVAPLPDEAQWKPSTQRVGGAPVLYTGYFRPDPAYPSQIVGTAWMDQSLTATQLIAGTRQPGGKGWPGQAEVPPGMRPTLVAAFNSGWKMEDINIKSFPQLPLRSVPWATTYRSSAGRRSRFAEDGLEARRPPAIRKPVHRGAAAAASGHLPLDFRGRHPPHQGSTLVCRTSAAIRATRSTMAEAGRLTSSRPSTGDAGFRPSSPGYPQL